MSGSELLCLNLTETRCRSIRIWRAIPLSFSDWRPDTHWGALDLLQEISDAREADISIQRELRFVDDGIITSAGVSAGIDMALHVVEQVCGASVAAETAHYMDYKGFACS